MGEISTPAALYPSRSASKRVVPRPATGSNRVSPPCPAKALELAARLMRKRVKSSFVLPGYLRMVLISSPK